MSKPTRYVYVTGCDSGFGRIAVDLFDKENFGVFAGVFLESSIAKIKQECPSGRVVPIPVNVRSEASVLEAARLIKEHLARENAQLYAVVNNAGILVQPCPTEWQSTQDFRDMLEVNVIGTAAVTQSVLPLIRQAKGRIVCTSSIAGRVGLPTESAYCASKFAVQGYADSLRRDMIAWGVSVHIVEPGVFPNTGLYERFEKGLDSVWARLDPQIKEDYGEDHYKFVRKQLTFAKDESARPTLLWSPRPTCTR
jgi:NAD(P)-dependent dehydrogenase (short-subunit alcohol dehydrogenase family)